MIAPFEVWDRRECTSRHTYEDEARRSCQNDRGRLLTIYAGDQIVAMYRDGKPAEAAL